MIARIHAQASAACIGHTGIEVEDIAVAILEFENGARGVIEGSTCTWSKDGQPVRVQLAGTEGSVFLADESFEVWDYKHEHPEDAGIRAKLKSHAAPGLGANDPSAIRYAQHQRNFEEIVTAIHEDREPATTASIARQAVAVIEAIYQSSRDGEKQTFSKSHVAIL